MLSLRSARFALAAAAVAASPLSAQIVFRARLSGDQVIPPQTSTALAFADLHLDAFTGNIEARLEGYPGLPAGTYAEICFGPPGQATQATYFNLVQVGGNRFAGRLTAPTATHLAELRNGDWCVELMPPPSVGTTPLLRGAIHAGADSFYFSGDGARALPPTTSTGRFSGSFGFAPNGNITYSIVATAQSPVTGAAIRLGDLVSETITVLQLTPTFGGTSALFIGGMGPISEATRAHFQQGRVWMTIATQNHPDTQANPGGELRGTLRGTQLEYGFGYAPNGFEPHIVNVFNWTQNGLVWIDIDHNPTGATFAAGMLCLSLAPLHFPITTNQELWVDPFSLVCLALPASGILTGQLPPGLQAGQWCYLQFLGLDTSARLYLTPGLAVQTVY